jgi:hypothetical protein
MNKQVFSREITNNNNQESTAEPISNNIHNILLSLILLSYLLSISPIDQVT